MAYNIQIVDSAKDININVKYQNLSKYKSPEVIAKTKEGVVVKERTVYQDKILPPGSTQRKWVSEDGTIYQKSELEFWYEDERVEENRQTKIFQIVSYEPLENYTDQFIIDKFYEIFASNNKMKSDYDRKKAINANTLGMRKLWELLKKEKKVARGEFCTSSRGFVPGDGYIRAVEFSTHWGLEIGVFKEKKIFQHLQEGIPELQQQETRKRLKMV